MAGVANFSVLTKHSYAAGQAPILTDHGPSTVEYTYVASAINIATAMLSGSEAETAMVQLARRFDQIEMQSNLFHDNLVFARQAVRSFVTAIRAEFPRVCIDESLTSPRILACHDRAEWVDPFSSRAQWVFINSKETEKMINASGSGATFRVFHFKLACTLVHEVGGHMLITYLSHGRPITPPAITSPAYAGYQFGGESGRFLEDALFGGCMEYRRDPSKGDDQPGIPHKVMPNGQAYRIPQSVVDNVVQYSFTFPFPVVGGPTQATVPSNQLVGQNSVGHERQLDNQHRYMLALVAEPYHGHLVRLDDVVRVPVHPEIRVRAA